VHGSPRARDRPCRRPRRGGHRARVCCRRGEPGRLFNPAVYQASRQRRSRLGWLIFDVANIIVVVVVVIVVIVVVVVVLIVIKTQEDSATVCGVDIVSFCICICIICIVEFLGYNIIIVIIVIVVIVIVVVVVGSFFIPPGRSLR
jgi:hypothetical protein